MGQLRTWDAVYGDIDRLRSERPELAEIFERGEDVFNELMDAVCGTDPL